MSMGTRNSEGARGVGSKSVVRRPKLDLERVLHWADVHRDATGHWPDRGSGPVGKLEGETWLGIDSALKQGRRGLPGGSSLAKLLAEERGVKDGANPASPNERMRAWEADQFPARRPKVRVQSRISKRPRVDCALSLPLILKWADAHHAATGKWPNTKSGPVLGFPALNWQQVNRALSDGLRGMPGGSSIANVLQEHRNIRNKQNLPRLTVEQVLAWADAHHAATGAYPDNRSGPVVGAPGEKWSAINAALSMGNRGLPSNTSLPRLWAEYRDLRGPLTIERILAWADAHHAATGKWPTSWSSGAVLNVPRENWHNINDCLRDGRRGLPGGTTLAQVLAEHRQAPNIYTETLLTVERILEWAKAHHAATGRWPSSNSGPVLHAEGENWGTLETALREGYRGLPGGQAVGRLIREHAGEKAYRTRPELTIEQILAWADAHRAATGKWPVEESGPIRDAPTETWCRISLALWHGNRGLPGGNSLARLLAEHRGARNKQDLPHLTIEQILAWADAHRAATGRWPTGRGGSVTEAPEENWIGINSALSKGHRGLPGGSSLSRLLAAHRPVRPKLLTMELIREWAAAHREATGRWPDAYAGPIRGVVDETWSGVDHALRFGHRGLPGGSSLTDQFDRSIDPNAQGIRPALTVEQVLAWVDAHRAATGKWPKCDSGPVAGMPGEKWVNLDRALRLGRRGLPSGDGLARFIVKHRGGPDAPTVDLEPRGGDGR